MLSAAHHASVDLGSHTVRLLVASCKDGHLVPVRLDRRITRLAAGFGEDRILGEEGVQRTLEALEDYKGVLEELRVRSVVCGATGVVRRAANREAFVDFVSGQTGIPVTVVSEEEEAFLSAKGVLGALGCVTQPVLMFDLGGSSTELLLAKPGRPEPVLAESVFVGAATVTERYIAGDPPDFHSLTTTAEAVRTAFAATLARLKGHWTSSAAEQGGASLIGTAGTVATLAAMYLKMEHYQPYRINGLRLSGQWVADTCRHLASLPVARRRGIPGLEEGREDIILGGAIIVREILRMLGRSAFNVTDAGFMEGLLMRLVEEERGEPRDLWSSLHWSFP